MTCTRKTALSLALAFALALPVAAAPADDALKEAQAAIKRRDGIAAEVALERALGQGAPRNLVAPAMGEAEMLQGDLVKAREWLGAGDFAPQQRLYGFHQLARLEMAEDNLPAAAEAFALASPWPDPAAMTNDVYA